MGWEKDEISLTTEFREVGDVFNWVNLYGSELVTYATKQHYEANRVIVALQHLNLANILPVEPFASILCCYLARVTAEEIIRYEKAIGRRE